MHAPDGPHIVLTLAHPDELFAGPSPGRASTPGRPPPTWDDLGAALGEPGVTRLLRMLQAQPRAAGLTIRLPRPAGTPEPGPDAADLEARLRRWCEAHIASDREQERLSRRIGLRVLAVCTVLLGLALLLSWALQSDAVLGPPGALRTLAAEAIVIAGWVVMWRPFEMLFFDPLRPAFERRLLQRALAMPWRVERA